MTLLTYLPNLKSLLNMLNFGFAVFEAITGLLEPFAFGNLLEVFIGGSCGDHCDDWRVL